MAIDGKFGLTIGSVADKIRKDYPDIAQAFDEIQNQVNRLFAFVDELQASDLANGTTGTGEVVLQDDATINGPLTILAQDYTVGPFLIIEQDNGSGAYGYELEQEQFAIGRLDLINKVAGVRTVGLRMMRNSGHLGIIVPTTVIASSDLTNSMISLWFDEGTSDIKCKVKTSAGVVKNGIVAPVV